MTVEVTNVEESGTVMLSTLQPQVSVRYIIGHACLIQMRRP